MSHLPSSLYEQLPGGPLPLAQSINASSRSALLVEDDSSLLGSIKSLLEKQGYAVRTASNAEEALRLYRECGPFNAVIVNYFAPATHGERVDYLAAQQTTSIDLATAISTIDPSQGIIIVALDYSSVAEVPALHTSFAITTDILQIRSLLEKIEVDRAIKSLTRCELLRLQRAAKFRIRGLGRAAASRNWEDLLGQALASTLIGAENPKTADRPGTGRHWNKTVTFVRHLEGAMRSIANQWLRGFQENVYLGSEVVVQDSDGQDYSLLDNAVSENVPSDQHLINREEEDRVFEMLKDDPEATFVLRAWINGLRQREIISKYGFVAKRYAATVKRIRQKLLENREY